MSQIRNDLCQQSIEELRQAFSSFKTGQKQNLTNNIQQPDQIKQDKEVSKVVEIVDQNSLPLQHNHCHVVPFVPMCCTYPQQSYIVYQQQSIESHKKKKKRTKIKREVIEEIRSQSAIRKQKVKLEQPQFNIEKEINQLEQLIRQVKVQQQPGQILEYNINLPEKEKKEKQEIIIPKQEPIIIRDDHLKAENARLQEEVKNTKIQYHELQVRYEDLLKQKRKEKIVKEIEYKEIPKIIEVPKEVIKEVIKPFEVIKEVIKEVERPTQINTKEIPIIIPQYKEITVTKEVPKIVEVPIEKEVKVYKDIPVYKDVPLYHDVPVFRDVPIYQKIPIYKEVPVYREPINVYKEIPLIKEVERIPEQIVEYPFQAKRLFSPQQSRTYIRNQVKQF